MRLRTKDEQQAYLDGYEMCAECIAEYLSDEGKQMLESLLVSVRNAVEIENIEPQSKTGHWIAQDIHNCHTDFKCSECGYIHSFMHLYGKPSADYTYCPNCGAKMVESQERSDKK